MLVVHSCMKERKACEDYPLESTSYSFFPASAFSSSLVAHNTLSLTFVPYDMFVFQYNRKKRKPSLCRLPFTINFPFLFSCFLFLLVLSGPWCPYYYSQPCVVLYDNAFSSLLHGEEKSLCGFFSINLPFLFSCSQILLVLSGLRCSNSILGGTEVKGKSGLYKGRCSIIFFHPFVLPPRPRWLVKPYTIFFLL